MDVVAERDTDAVTETDTRGERDADGVLESAPDTDGDLEAEARRDGVPDVDAEAEIDKDVDDDTVSVVIGVLLDESVIKGVGLAKAERGGVAEREGDNDERCVSVPSEDTEAEIDEDTDDDAESDASPVKLGKEVSEADSDALPESDCDTEGKGDKDDSAEDEDICDGDVVPNAVSKGVSERDDKDVADAAPDTVSLEDAKDERDAIGDGDSDSDDKPELDACADWELLIDESAEPLNTLADGVADTRGESVVDKDGLGEADECGEGENDCDIALELETRASGVLLCDPDADSLKDAPIVTVSDSRPEKDTDEDVLGESEAIESVADCDAEAEADEAPEGELSSDARGETVGGMYVTVSVGCEETEQLADELIDADSVGRIVVVRVARPEDEAALLADTECEADDDALCDAEVDTDLLLVPEARGEREPDADAVGASDGVS